MPVEKSKENLKQKVNHELASMAFLSAYLAFFFCALATYSMLLLNKLHLSFFAYGTALINAIVIAKVILIGEYARVGTRFEARSLVLSAIWKSMVFGVLVFVFHVLEEMIKELVHGKRAVEAFHEIRLDDLLLRSVVIFCTFIPLFVFRELNRVMGHENFHTLFFRSTSVSTPPDKNAPINAG